VSVIGISLNAMTFDAMMIWSIFSMFWVAAGIMHGNVLRVKETDRTGRSGSAGRRVPA
jgi:hypothetical protein